MNTKEVYDNKCIQNDTKSVATMYCSA
jgi:hypothetical protein